jgi:hypothetical protein
LTALPVTTGPVCAASADTSVLPDPPGLHDYTSLPIRSIALFTSGVAQVRHDGPLQDNVTVKIPFKPGQIDDVLKSLLLESTAGTTATVVYPSSDPLGRVLGEFQVNLEEPLSMSQLLTRLRGARVRVKAGGDDFEGTVLGTEERAVAGQDASVEPATEGFLNLLHEGQLRSLPMQHIGHIDILDPLLRQDLQHALEILDQNRGQAQKPVVIRFSGTGAYTAAVSYIVEAPVWKSSYRLQLTERDATKARLSGWALVENQTGSDWNNITLSLVNGQPVSFVQDLSTPLYAKRPRLKAPERPMVEPRMDSRTAEAMPEAAVAAPAPRKSRALLLNQSGAGEATAAEDGAVAPADNLELTAPAHMVAAMPVGPLFRYTVEGISLPRQHSAMLPLLDAELNIESISLYSTPRAGRPPASPLHGILLENSSGTPLPAGPMTIFHKGVYSGDAMLDDLPIGQKRFLAYAADHDLVIPVPDVREQGEITAIRIVRGTVYISRQRQKISRYQLDNRSDQRKVVILEHATRGSGWKLTTEATPATAKPDVVDSAPGWYRIRVELAPRMVLPIVMTEQKVDQEHVSLLTEKSPMGLVVGANQAVISENLRNAIKQVAILQGELTDMTASLQQSRERLQELEKEQKRLRDNLQSVHDGSKFHERIMEKLSECETAIERWQAETERLRNTADEQKKRIERYLANLSVD